MPMPPRIQMLDRAKEVDKRSGVTYYRACRLARSYPDVDIRRFNAADLPGNHLDAHGFTTLVALRLNGPVLSQPSRNTYGINRAPREQPTASDAQAVVSRHQRKPPAAHYLAAARFDYYQPSRC
jgi:hypothetical protein